MVGILDYPYQQADLMVKRDGESAGETWFLDVSGPTNSLENMKCIEM